MTEVPRLIPVDAMPTFTVLTPYYSEKVSCGKLLFVPNLLTTTLLDLSEIICEEDQYTHFTSLKQLHPIECENFVNDTMILAEELTILKRRQSVRKLMKRAGQRHI